MSEAQQAKVQDYTDDITRLLRRSGEKEIYVAFIDRARRLFWILTQPKPR